MIWLTPNAMPRCASGKASVRMAAELAINMDPPMAWTSRKPISHRAPASPLAGSSDRAMDAAVKMTKPRL